MRNLIIVSTICIALILVGVTAVLTLPSFEATRSGRGIIASQFTKAQYSFEVDYFLEQEQFKCQSVDVEYAQYNHKSGGHLGFFYQRNSTIEELFINGQALLKDKGPRGLSASNRYAHYSFHPEQPEKVLSWYSGHNNYDSLETLSAQYLNLPKAQYSEAEYQDLVKCPRFQKILEEKFGIGGGLSYGFKPNPITYDCEYRSLEWDEQGKFELRNNPDISIKLIETPQRFFAYAPLNKASRFSQLLEIESCLLESGWLDGKEYVGLPIER